jgi:hypothetical protein
MVGWSDVRITGYSDFRIIGQDGWFRFFVQKSSDPVILQSSDPAIQQSSNPAIQQSENLTINLTINKGKFINQFETISLFFNNG